MIFIRKTESRTGKLSSVHDLSHGERQYLARKNIRGREFDNMSEREQREWKNEMREGAYEKNDRELGTLNNVFKY